MSDITINITPQVHRYLIENSVREPAILADLRMHISPEQGSFMVLLMEILGARKTLDIGTFTGYSALAVAMALPHDGKVIAFDINKEWTSIAWQFWQKSGVGDKIELKLGPAQESLQGLIAAGETNSFDFAFIDADKANYDRYYEQALQLVRSGGIIAIDNVLWSGKVADPDANDESTRCIRDLNSKLMKDNRVTICMLPIGDGLTLARKR